MTEHCRAFVPCLGGRPFPVPPEGLSAQLARLVHQVPGGSVLDRAASFVIHFLVRKSFVSPPFIAYILPHEVIEFDTQLVS